MTTAPGPTKTVRATLLLALLGLLLPPDLPAAMERSASLDRLMGRLGGPAPQIAVCSLGGPGSVIRDSISPGSQVVCLGRGFGTSGNFTLTLSGGTKVVLGDIGWTDGAVIGRVAPDLKGVTDQGGVLRVENRGGRSNEWPVLFIATRVTVEARMPIQFIRDQCVTPDPDDYCGLNERPMPGALLNRHRWARVPCGESGTDKFRFHLVNGWGLTRIEVGYCKDDAPSFPWRLKPGSDGTVELDWNLGWGLTGAVSYGFKAFITGPAGIPWFKP